MVLILFLWMIMLHNGPDAGFADPPLPVNVAPARIDNTYQTQEGQDMGSEDSPTDSEILYGYAKKRFSTGKIIHEDRLNDQSAFQKNWVVQQSQADPQLERYARISEGRLHVHDPRGTTIWFRQKLKGPVMISYRITCPSEYNSGTDIVPRDINQFWMAIDPENPDPDQPGGLFDGKKYNGTFGTYDRLNCYYASTGGGNVTDNNRTVRFRRYPRKSGHDEIAHVALDDKDENPDFLIRPDHEYLVQLVAADDIVQFIFDGKVVYELQQGDQATLSVSDEAEKVWGTWGKEPWTLYREGWFGFRMTRTHHVYRDFKVYSLIPK